MCTIRLMKSLSVICNVFIMCNIINTSICLVSLRNIQGNPITANNEISNLDEFGNILKLNQFQCGI